MSLYLSDSTKGMENNLLFPKNRKRFVASKHQKNRFQHDLRYFVLTKNIDLSSSYWGCDLPEHNHTIKLEVPKESKVRKQSMALIRSQYLQKNRPHESSRKRVDELIHAVINHAKSYLVVGKNDPLLGKSKKHRDEEPSISSTIQIPKPVEGPILDPPNSLDSSRHHRLKIMDEDKNNDVTKTFHAESELKITALQRDITQETDWKSTKSTIPSGIAENGDNVIGNDNPSIPEDKQSMLPRIIDSSNSFDSGSLCGFGIQSEGAKRTQAMENVQIKEVDLKVTLPTSEIDFEKIVNNFEPYIFETQKSRGRRVIDSSKSFGHSRRQYGFTKLGDAWKNVKTKKGADFRLTSPMIEKESEKIRQNDQSFIYEALRRSIEDPQKYRRSSNKGDLKKSSPKKDRKSREMTKNGRPAVLRFVGLPVSASSNSFDYSKDHNVFEFVDEVIHRDKTSLKSKSQKQASPKTTLIKSKTIETMNAQPKDNFQEVLLKSASGCKIKKSTEKDEIFVSKLPKYVGGNNIFVPPESFQDLGHRDIFQIQNKGRKRNRSCKNKSGNEVAKRTDFTVTKNIKTQTLQNINMYEANLKTTLPLTDRKLKKTTKNDISLFVGRSDFTASNSLECQDLGLENLDLIRDEIMKKNKPQTKIKTLSETALTKSKTNMMEVYKVDCQKAVLKSTLLTTSSKPKVATTKNHSPIVSKRTKFVDRTIEKTIIDGSRPRHGFGTVNGGSERDINFTKKCLKKTSTQTKPATLIKSKMNAEAAVHLQGNTKIKKTSKNPTHIISKLPQPIRRSSFAPSNSLDGSRLQKCYKITLVPEITQINFQV